MDNTNIRAFAAAILCACGTAAAQIPSATITVVDDRYAVGSRSFGDLNTLERELRPFQPAAISVIACGSSNGRAVKAIAHRFRHVPVTIVPRLEDEAPCTNPILVPASHGPAQRPTGIDDAEVDRYWSTLKP